MSDYDGLDDLIGKVKRAAIDVYMTDTANYYEIEGDRYRYRGSGRGMTQYCTRPNEAGEGGGDVSLDGMPDVFVNHLDEDYRAAFDGIRGQVDAIFENLRGVPRGDSLYYEENRSMDAAERLTPSGATTELAEGGGSSLDLNNPALSGRVNAIHGYSYRLSSQTVNAFRQAYADRLSAVLDGQAVLAATLGMAAAGQRAVFATLRDDIVTFAKEAEASLAAQAGVQAAAGGSGDVFTVGGALLGIASAAGGPGALAFGAAGGLSGLIGSFWPEKPEKKSVTFSGNDLDSILGSISDGRTKLLETPVDDEEAIRSALSAAHDATRSAPGSFDLSRPAYPSTSSREDVGGPGTIVQNRDDMQQLAANCYLVAEELGEARAMLESMNGGSGEWSRPSGIGIGTTGPFAQFDTLASDAVVLVRNTAEELGEAATKLIAASLDFEATDSQISQRLAQETSELRAAEEAGDLVFD
jgi:hypothetical protein